MKDLLIVTSNANKVREFQEMLEPLGFHVLSLRDYDDYEDIPEDGDSFQENAKIKAEHGMKKYGVYAIADDSGLCIHGLNDEPGIHSARYMGHDTSYEEKNKNLIGRLEGNPNRGAAFHCAIAFAIPGEETKVFEGIWEGEITNEPKGTNGFGYDPIFLVPGYGKTSAELSPEEKNAISHRGQATKMFLDYLKTHPITEEKE